MTADDVKSYIPNHAVLEWRKLNPQPPLIDCEYVATDGDFRVNLVRQAGSELPDEKMLEEFNNFMSQ